MLIYNFAPGPAMLPQVVEARVMEAMVDFQGTGLSVLEQGHRDPIFAEKTLRMAEANLRFLWKVPDDHAVLFLSGGASLHFAGAPMNLLGGGRSKLVDYVNTGYWAEQAITEAMKYTVVRVAGSGAKSRFTAVPTQNTWELHPRASYVHITSNETIGGVEYHWVPETGDVPLVADMSSNILSRSCDVSRYGLIYASAAKNMGIPGLTIVIVRRDLLGRAMRCTPSVLNYGLQDKAGSLLNTPPTIPIFVAGEMFKWIIEQGGVEALAEQNDRKAKLLYDYIDGSDGFYRNPVSPESRSRMNVIFRLPTPELEKKFVEEAAKRGLVGLAGHRSVGGLRASIYNAMPIEGVQELINFMMEFKENHG